MTKPYALLGLLTPVPLREIWQNESLDFTPWLAEENNLRLLSETLGLDLELQAREQYVGPFKADILCKDSSTDTFVLIENQIERTDHAHLGQLLTYAAGLNAVSVVWVAAKFTDEHRAALDWLNSSTNENINFFGLEIELWRIGDSNIAPKFNIVSQPNNWSKTVAYGVTSAEPGELTDRKLLQKEFWISFSDFVASQKTQIRTTKPSPQHWMNMSLGRSGTHLSAVASFFNTEDQSYDSHEVRAEVVLNDQSSKSYFEQLALQREHIESELGESLSWHNPTNARACRIYVRRPANLEDRSTWPDCHQWLLKKLEALKRVFGSRVKELQTGAIPGDEVPSVMNS